MFLSFLATLLGFLLLLILSAYLFLQHAFKYWDEKGIPVIPPSFPAGNVGPVFSRKQNFGHFLQDLYNQLKTKGPFGGFYLLSRPALLVCDPDRIKDIFMKDFSHFQNRGDKWKNMRHKLSPSFTSGKLKNMFSIMLNHSTQLEDYLSKNSPGNNVFEVKDIFARFTTDIIGSCAFGIECNSLENPESEFRKNGLKIFAHTVRENINHAFCLTYKNLAKKLNLTTVNKSVSSFFLKFTRDIISYREANNVKRNDFVDLLMQLKKTGTLDGYASKEGETSPLTINQIAAQLFLFFVAGFETSSSTMSFCLYELALHQDIQDTVRQEITDVFGGDLTYDGILQLDYLDKVIYETMRKYPPVPMLTRECTNDYTLPNTKTTISKDTIVFIPIRGLHYDPEIFPNPDQFNPERFNKDNKLKRHPFSYLPFGEGPRNCIGLRLGMLITKLGLVTLLRRHRWTVCDETSIPLEIDPISFVTNSISGILLNCEQV